MSKQKRERKPQEPQHRGAIRRAKDPRSALRRLLSYMKPFQLQIGVIVVLVVITTLLSTVNPYLIGVAIDQFITTGDIVGLLRISLIILSTYIAGAITSMGSRWIMARVAHKALRNLRKELFEHIQTLSLSFFDRTPTGDLMSRLTNDINTINQAISQNVTGFITSVFTSASILVLMFSLNIWLTLAILLLSPIMGAAIAFQGKRVRSRYRSLQKNLGMLNSNMEENLSGERVVIAFEKREEAMESFDKINLAVRDTGIMATFYAYMIAPFTSTLINTNIAVVSGLGGWLVLNGMASIGNIASFISFARQFSQPIRQIAYLYNHIQSALAASERIFEIIDLEPELQDAPDAVSLDDVEGEVIFDNVDFGYVPDVPVLKNVSLHAKPGQNIALVGPTGAGKTTIVNVLTRFYDIQGGTITIDDYEVDKILKDNLRRQLGIVLQDVFLFSGTVMENIKYGRLDATDEECIEAAKLANADQFILRLPQGYQTQLSEQGRNLSQGQRQLLSLARTIIADPSILILDEATSSVDSRTELQIQEALSRFMKGRTSFVIAHRLSTIRKADQLLVINEGRIIERGTHKQLLQQQGFYYNLYMSQFKRS